MDRDQAERMLSILHCRNWMKEEKNIRVKSSVDSKFWETEVGLATAWLGSHATPSKWKVKRSLLIMRDWKLLLINVHSFQKELTTQVSWNTILSIDCFQTYRKLWGWHVLAGKRRTWKWCCCNMLNNIRMRKRRILRDNRSWKMPSVCFISSTITNP